MWELDTLEGRVKRLSEILEAASNQLKAIQEGSVALEVALVAHDAVNEFLIWYEGEEEKEVAGGG